MRASRNAIAPLMLAGALLISGCEQSTQEVPSEDCFVESLGKREFLGSPECLAQFETEPMSGYWVVELEYSLFYPTRDDLMRGSRDGAFALSFLNRQSGAVRELLLGPEKRVFKVSFDGSKSDIPGIYAEEMPELRGGVVVRENFSIEDEIPDVPAPG